ncbi:MAG: flagellar hook-basal body protein [Butyrivibrio sp.]|nr:flagellar hook-basal body protein [Muribaculum sp.]MCM1551334.1 flagellar hook-basal body protein [Butyrivibrio sp.]
MLRGLYTAWSGMVNEQNRMDIMTNNLANASTVGFKKEGATSQAFDDVLTVKLKDRSVGLTTVERTGIRNPGVKIGENYTDYGQGSFRDTGNTFDLALSGEGFFAIEFTNKANETTTMYTRAGQFTLNREGYLVTQDGDFVLDTNNNRIQLDTLKETSIDKTGAIRQDGGVIARIQVADFENYDYLEKYGETYYRPIEGAERTNGTATINSGYLEMANVQIVSEMVNMISITRAYEANQKLIQTYDDSLEIAVTQLGRVQ